jgi:hypothetical protein
MAVLQIAAAVELPCEHAILPLKNYQNLKIEVRTGILLLKILI